MGSAREVGQRFRSRMKAPDLHAYFTSTRRSRVALETGGQSRCVAELSERCAPSISCNLKETIAEETTRHLVLVVAMLYH
jgi:hypothetical protein